MPFRHRRSLTWLTRLALLALVAVTLVGCNKYSAKRNHRKMQRILSEIQVHEETTQGPYLFRNDEVVSLEGAIGDVGRMIAGEDYQGASERARQWMESAPALRDNIIAEHAQHILELAEADIGVAQDNMGNLEDPDLWDRILERRDRAREKRSEQNWEDVIEISQKIIDEVSILLINLQNRADQGLQRANIAMAEFDDLNAALYASALMVESQQLTAIVEEHIASRRYSLAITAAEQALTKINETIIASKSALSAEGIREIESLLTEIAEHGADLRLRDRYQAISDHYADLLRFHYNEDYDEALNQIRSLRPQAQTLLINTYQTEAEALIALREEELGHLREAEVDHYLPGRIDLPTELHDTGTALYTEAMRRMGEIEAIPEAELQGTRLEMLLSDAKPIFSDAVEQSYAAGNEIDNIHLAFRELSETHLAGAQSAIQVVTDVLDRFEGIWDPRVDRVNNPADAQFEENKQVFRQEIETRIETARAMLMTAEDRLQTYPLRYNLAIQYSDQAREWAEEALADAYRVVARNSLIELTWLVSLYEREGAGEYATAELDRTLRLIEEARVTLDTGPPRDAVADCAAARAQLEIMVQALRRTANELITDLRAQETETARLLRAIEAPERLTLISELRINAEDMARSDSLKDAIETAQRALDLAEQTAAVAAREWAEVEMSRTDAAIAGAEGAGAALYGAATLQEARDLSATAQSRLQEGDFLTAQELAAEAGVRAAAAQTTLLDRAEESTERAREYEGFRFHTAALADALVAAQQAAAAMHAGHHIESQELARFASQRADEITVLSRHALFAERVFGLHQSVQHAINTGASFFQPEDLQAVLQDLARIEANYTAARHDDHERDLEVLEARMAIIIEGTPQILVAIIDTYREWMRTLRDDNDADRYAYEELQRIAELMISAQRNFAEGHHRLSHTDVQRAGRLLTIVQVMTDEFDYKASADEILAQLEAARIEFADYIEISPPMMIQLAISPGGSGRATAIVSGLSPTELRREVERLQTLAEAIDSPPTRVDHHTRMLACLRNMQSAARNFEYLSIADQMDERTITATIESAYRFLEASRRQSTELTRGLLEAPLAGPVTMTEMGRPLLRRAEDHFAYGQYN